MGGRLLGVGEGGRSAAEVEVCVIVALFTISRGRGREGKGRGSPGNKENIEKKFHERKKMHIWPDLVLLMTRARDGEICVVVVVVEEVS
jgi:hypothetical protein